MLVCFLYNARHKDSSCGQKIEVGHGLESFGNCIVFTGNLEILLTELSLITINIVSRRIIGNVDVGDIIQICEVCNLVPISVICNSNCSKIILREDMVLVN